jgi:hypothetical protein
MKVLMRFAEISFIFHIPSPLSGIQGSLFPSNSSLVLISGVQFQQRLLPLE